MSLYSTPPLNTSNGFSIGWQPSAPQYKCSTCGSPYCNGQCGYWNRVNTPTAQDVQVLVDRALGEASVKMYEALYQNIMGVTETKQSKPTVGRLFRIPTANGGTVDTTEADARKEIKRLRKHANAIERALKR